MNSADAALIKSFVSDYMASEDAKQDIEDYMVQHPGMTFKGATNDISYRAAGEMRSQIYDYNFKLKGARNDRLTFLIGFLLLLAANLIGHFFL